MTTTGLVTTVRAEATGIDVGGAITIGKIATEAITQAWGRHGTTRARFTRTITDVHGPGIDCIQCDPKRVVDAINQAFGAFMRARLPEEYKLASEHGYQGVVSKNPALRASDQAVNDDDTATVDGLDIITYYDNSPANADASAGRSRLVIGFAGVQSLSQYGIFLLPPTSGGSSGGDFTSFPPGPGAPVVNPPTQPTLTGNQAQPNAAPPILSAPVGAVGGALKLVVTNPREAVLLFLLWGLLASPLYFGLRRRARARALGL
jgi:hypothetical protein